MSAPAAVIELNGLTKIYRGFLSRRATVAVHELSFRLERGEILGLLGPNGSGKTTTLKTLLGLLHPTSGSLSILGYPPRSIEVKKRLGFMPEESYLPRYLTAEEVLDFYGRLFTLPAAVRREKNQQLLNLVGLEGARHQKVKEFSKGMMRRLTFAQALLNDPEVLILDEPTSGLDPLASRHMKDLILSFKREGKTILMTSHLLADVEDVCDRIAILHKGRLLKLGSVQDLLKVPHRVEVVLEPPANKTLDQLKKMLEEQHWLVRKIQHPTQTLEEFFLQSISSEEKTPGFPPARE